MRILVRWFAVTLTCCILQMYGSEPQKQSASQPTLMQSVAVGSMAGVTEVCLLGQPLSYAMNQMVQGKSLSSNPLHWYRGCVVNAAGMAPMRAIQKAGSAQLQVRMKETQDHDLSHGQRMGASFVAGAASALVSTPSEAIPVYMQKTENARLSTWQAASTLKARAWRGLVPTAKRDGLFTVGYDALAPMMQEQACTVMDKSSAEVAGGIGAGVATAVVTQPLVVIKTAMQANPNYRSSLQAARAIYSDSGATGFFRGLTPRGSRVIIAIPVLTKASEIYTTLVTQLNK